MPEVIPKTPALVTYIQGLPGPSLLLLLAGLLFCGFVAGWLLAAIRKRRQLATLEYALDGERRLAEERDAAMETKFAALSSAALRQNNSAFLDLAQQVLARFHTEAKGDLELKEKAVQDLVWPIREALSRTEQQIHELDRERRQTHGALTKQLESLARSQQNLQGETRNLVQALRRPEVRGQWGELTLRRLTELAGMVEHADFDEQVTAGERNTLRPDMVVHMPAGRQVVVDVKTPLDAYLSAVEATDDGARNRALKQHARHVRERIRELAAKRYWDQFQQAPEFVVLFIPGDQFLAAALDQDHELLEDALARKVILATPTSFVALLRAVAYGWRQESVNRNADKIRVLGEDLYRRICTLATHLGKLGRNLDASISQYNSLVGSFEGKVLPGARKFVDLGVTVKTESPTPQQIEKGPRSVAQADE